MSWLADNATSLYILLAIVAAGLVVVWRFNGRAKFLVYAVGVLGLLIVVWLLAQIIPSDAKLLESNVRAMAAGVEAGKMDDVFKHVAKDFDYKGMTRDVLYEESQKVIKAVKVREVVISNFGVTDVSRAGRFAKTRFRVTVRTDSGQRMSVTQADFVLEGNDWKLKTMRLYNPLVNQDQEINMPGIQ